MIIPQTKFQEQLSLSDEIDNIFRGAANWLSETDEFANNIRTDRRDFIKLIHASKWRSLKRSPPHFVFDFNTHDQLVRESYEPLWGKIQKRIDIEAISIINNLCAGSMQADGKFHRKEFKEIPKTFFKLKNWCLFREDSRLSILHQDGTLHKLVYEKVRLIRDRKVAKYEEIKQFFALAQKARKEKGQKLLNREEGRALITDEFNTDTRTSDDIIKEINSIEKNKAQRSGPAKI